MFLPVVLKDQVGTGLRVWSAVLPLQVRAKESLRTTPLERSKKLSSERVQRVQIPQGVEDP